MDHVPTIVVRKGGFLAALAYGFFGTIIAVVVCGSVLAFSAIRLADREVSHLISVAREVVEVLPEWQEALPPALSDTLNDRRDLNYLQHVKVSAKLGTDILHDKSYTVVEVANNGNSAVTLMSLRVVVEDSDGVPVREFTTYAATPLAIDGDWRGPLLPGSKRRFTIGSHRSMAEGVTANAEVTELRVWSDSDEKIETAQREVTPSAAQAADTAQATVIAADEGSVELLD